MADHFPGGRATGWIVAFALMTALPAAWAQETPLPEDQAGTAVSSTEPAQDPLGPPTELGIRLTPQMARAIAKRLVQQAGPQYELDAAKNAEAAELLARRLMAAAHATDGKANELLEWVLGYTLRINSGENRNQGMTFMTPEFQAGLAQHLMPLLPATKDFVRGAAQDIMPLLPLKQRLKLSGQILLAGTALDVFEKNMQRWSRGEGGPNEDPFSTPAATPEMMKKDANGETVALQRAREAAAKEADREALLKSVWGSYLADAKKYYALDAAQCASGDSLLRECLERARGMIKDPTWHDRYCRVRLWQGVVWRTRMSRAGFFNQILKQEDAAALQPFDALGDEFRLRVDEIPTQEQRAAAEARITAALADHGYTTTQEAK